MANTRSFRCLPFACHRLCDIHSIDNVHIQLVVGMCILTVKTSNLAKYVLHNILINDNRFQFCTWERFFLDDYHLF